jgi:hypothetical protein
MKRNLCYLLAIVGLVASSGATCQRPIIVNPFAAPGPSAPQILVEDASREQLIAAVNQNSAKIRSLTATGATITIPDTLGLPLLKGNIAAERPGRFRLTAGTVVTGKEIDVGSNDELFWLWVRSSQPPAVYLCKHEQFANSNIRQVMPIEPTWLLAALGIVDIDPASVYAGPVPRSDGTLEISSYLPSSAGRLIRVTAIDARRAWVVEQHVYDPSGTKRLASAVAESHRYYPVEQLSLPERLSIDLPTSGLKLKIDLGVMQINQLPGDPQQLWTLPSFEGIPQYDLGSAVPGTPVPGRLNAPQPPPAAANGVAPAGYTGYPTTGLPAPSAAYLSAPQANARDFMPLPRYGLRQRPAPASTATSAPTDAVQPSAYRTQ